MKWIVYILLLISTQLFGTNYYVSNSGSDFNNGLTPETAWQTLSKLDGFNFNGDTINFKRGDVWNDSIYIHDYQGINLDAYGVGAKPLITGYTEITEWVNLGGGIYYYILPSTEKLRLLNVDGYIRDKGMFPNQPINHTEANNNTVTDDVYSTENWTGARLVTNNNRFAMSDNLIASQAGNTLTLTPSYPYYPISSEGIEYWSFVTNDIRTFDIAGDWAQREDTLFIYAPDGISNHAIKYPAIQYGMTLSYTCTVKNIEITGFNKVGIQYIGAASIKMDSVEINETNIGFTTTQNITDLFIDSCVIEKCTGEGIGYATSKIISDSSFCTNSKVDSIGMWLTLVGRTLENPYVSGSGVRTAYSNVSEFKNNTVSEVCYNGIHYLRTDTTTLTGNYFKNCTKYLKDGGSIYTGQSGIIDTTLHYPALISNNISIGGLGMAYYLDQSSNYTEVVNNLAVNPGWYAFFTNDGRNISVTDNVFVGCDNIGMSVTFVGDSTRYPESNIFKNNIVEGSGYLFRYHIPSGLSLDSEITGMGMVDSNTYIVSSLMADNFYLGYYNPITFTELQGYGYDLHSTESLYPNFNVRVNTSFTELLTLSSDSIYTFVDGSTQIGGTILPMSWDAFINVSKYTVPKINSILGGYYGDYINGGYYGRSIIGTKQ